jgi:hypothetical protein
MFESGKTAYRTKSEWEKPLPDLATVHDSHETHVVKQPIKIIFFNPKQDRHGHCLQGPGQRQGRCRIAFDCALSVKGTTASDPRKATWNLSISKGSG